METGMQFVMTAMTVILQSIPELRKSAMTVETMTVTVNLIQAIAIV
jgi:hypothetical protein